MSPKILQFSVGNNWDPLLQEFEKSVTGKTLISFLRNEQKNGKTVFPSPEKIFRALALTAPEKIKIVILGQDPYHGDGEADGLAFSTSLKIYPPSLRNIFKELGGRKLALPSSGSLEKWATQGVFLLNPVLTVRKKSPLSHVGIGWENFTRILFKKIDSLPQPICFLLWGKYAATFEANISLKSERLVLKSSHPSPLAAYRGFHGCNHFEKAATWLQNRGVKPPDLSFL